MDDLLDEVSCIGGFWAPGPVKLSGVHGWLDDGHNWLALQLHVGLKKLQMLTVLKMTFFFGLNVKMKHGVTSSHSFIP